MDKRLEELSDMVRKGTPIDIGEAIEVVDYQARLRVERADKRDKTIIGRIVNFFKPNAPHQARHDSDVALNAVVEGGKMKTRSQSEHEAINQQKYPGTRQLCKQCGDPTERCEEDDLYLHSGEGPLCVGCYDTANAKHESRSDALLATDVLAEMDRIMQEWPCAMEYETDARDTWPLRWGELREFLAAKRDTANTRR